MILLHDELNREVEKIQRRILRKKVENYAVLTIV